MAWLAVVAVVGVLLSGCASGPRGFCSAAGCESGLAVTVPADLIAETAYEVEVCVDDTCHRETLRVPPPADGPNSGVTIGALTLDVETDTVRLSLGQEDWSGTHTVSVTVLLGTDALLQTEDVVEFTVRRPNGPDCPPTCWFAELVA